MKIYFIVLMLFFFIDELYPQEIKEEAEKIIRDAFKKEVDISMEKYEIDKDLKAQTEYLVKQKFFGSHIYLFKIFSGDNLIAVALLDNVYGKSQPITFIVLFDLQGGIIISDIVKYREAYGGAVSSEKWNEQFKGKNSESSFKVGEDIDSISGATISVNSVTLGIKKLAILFNEIRKNL